jgi:type I restriction-modification system DNA methylase subunit
MTAGFGENRLAEKPTSLPGNIWYLKKKYKNKNKTCILIYKFFQRNLKSTRPYEFIR